MGDERNLVGSTLNANLASQWFSKESFPSLELNKEVSKHPPTPNAKASAPFGQGSPARCRIGA